LRLRENPIVIERRTPADAARLQTDIVAEHAVRNRGLPAVHRQMSVNPTTDDQRWTVYEEHSAALRRFVRRRVEAEAVEDVLANTFVVAWQKLPKQVAQDPLPWLYAVAHRAVQTHHRSVRRRVRLATRLMAHHGDRHTADPAVAMVENPVLARAFAQLSNFDREAICLVAWEGLSHEDAARVTGCSAATFAVRISRARTRLAAALEAVRERDDRQQLCSTDEAWTG
jgi:RNA polymerase sigma factor (sigma-70 family)